MQIKQQIILKSKEAVRFFRIPEGKRRTLFDTIVHKIAMLYNLGKQQHVYAYIDLVNIKTGLTQLIDDMEHTIKNIKKAIKRRYGETPKNKIAHHYKSELTFSNGIVFTFIQTIKKFDELVCLLNLGRSMGIFSHQNNFYKIKNQHKKPLLRCLFTILRIPTKNIPTVTIQHYLNNDSSYQKAAAQRGEIEPQTLYHALCSPATPTLSAETLNRITSQLKRKVSIC